ncbi:MAG: methionine--tRNA ligase [Comamonas sp.]|uniref:methionine--tRNA ligase n=1 Tax=Comamonas sp. TaxID=34028 RepID=UPI002FCC4973
MPLNLAPRKLFVTTALPYANGPLHLGHLLEYIQADTWVRAQRMAGHAVQFVCADDAHGAPIMIAAQKAGVTPQQYIADIARSRAAYLAGFHIRFDNWHSTHSTENQQLAQDIYRKLQARNLIARKDIEQFYDPVEGMFLPDRYVKGSCPRCGAPEQHGDSCDACGAVYAPTDVGQPRSILSGAVPELRNSTHLFFRLSDPAIQAFLRSWTADATLQPEIARKVSEWFADGLQDWDISRDAPYFGIPIPGEIGKFFYVWLDAPVGYLASLKNHFDKGGARNHWHVPSRTAQTFDEFLGDPLLEQVHFIGKDIIYFHALFWPAMLHFSGLRLPSKINAHGHLTVRGEKMSKSKGNGLDPLRYLDLGLDADWIRYYLAAKLNGGIDDTDFNPQDFVARVNADLVGKFVNIASRCSGFILKKFDATLGLPDQEGLALLGNLQTLVEQAGARYEAREYARCIRESMAMADQVNAYFDRNKPWELAKKPECEAQLLAVCTACLEAFRLLCILLKPVIPALVGRAQSFLQIAELDFASGARRMGPGHRIGAYRHLTHRVDSALVEQAFGATHLPSGCPRPMACAEKTAAAKAIDAAGN